MRDIKFRAWNKVTEMMFSVGEYMQPCSPAFVGAVSDDDLNQFPLPECELMQYTGLKDKNGVEIYEGDIIMLSDMKLKLKVFFEGGAFMFKDMDEYPTIWRFHPKQILEVIGNIYEHSDLLDTTSQKESVSS